MSSQSAELRRVLRDLCAEQWAALGTSFARAHGGHTRGVIDLEALLLLTLEVGRDDPRLFDEALDWCAHSEPLLSTHRLRSMCRDEVDVQLVAAVIRWLGSLGPRGAATSSTRPTETPLTLFPGVPLTSDPDPAFAAEGVLRPVLSRSGKSRAPDLMAPASLGLRLRTVFGTGAMSEVARLLVTTDAPRVDTQVLIRGACFSPKRVREAAARLADAGFVDSSVVAHRIWITPRRDAWAAWLGVPAGDLPRAVDWPQLLSACTYLARSLPALEATTDAYLRASDARHLWTTIEPDLQYAGVPITSRPFAPGEAYWEPFLEAVREVTAFVGALTG